jgi:hypothetical protein
VALRFELAELKDARRFTGESMTWPEAIQRIDEADLLALGFRPNLDVPIYMFLRRAAESPDVIPKRAHPTLLSPKPLTGKDWLNQAADRHARKGDVPTEISAFAGTLLTEMRTAKTEGRVRSCYSSAKSIEARLHERDLWPVKPKK